MAALRVRRVTYPLAARQLCSGFNIDGWCDCGSAILEMNRADVIWKPSKLSDFLKRLLKQPPGRVGMVWQILFAIVDHDTRYHASEVEGEFCEIPEESPCGIHSERVLRTLLNIGHHHELWRRLRDEIAKRVR